MQRKQPRPKAIRQCNLLASRLQDANTPTAVLVAYVTPETADDAALLAAAHAKLPAYMAPSAIVKLAELPRLASGKVCCRLLSKVRPVPVPQRLAIVFIQDRFVVIMMATHRSPARRCPAARGLSVPLSL